MELELALLASHALKHQKRRLDEGFTSVSGPLRVEGFGVGVKFRRSYCGVGRLRLSSKIGAGYGRHPRSD